MKRLRGSGLLGLAWGLLLAWCVSGALARQVPPLAETGAPLTLGDRGDYWIDAGGRASLAEVLALPPSAFAPTRSDRYYPLRDGQALWIRFEVAPTPGSLRWYLALPDTRLDRATLYTPGPSGWTEQTAGDDIAVSQWPLPHAHPALALALSTTEATPVVLRIAGSEGFWTAPHFETERRQDARQQRASLIAGMYFGLLSMAVLFGLICAAVFRDRAYLWFSLFAMGINLVVARTVGIAGLHFWPDSPRWNNAAEHVLSITSMAPLLAFVAVALSLRNRKQSLYLSVCALALLALLGAALAWLVPPGGRLALTILFVLGLSLTGLAITGWAWWRGDRFARWILLAFTPMLAALPFPVGRWLQWLPQSFLTQHAIQLSLMLTVPAVLLLLIIRSQERLDYRRRITRLDHVDPLTGLVNDQVFGHRLRGMIERSRRLDCESAVMLVDFTNLEAIGREFGRKAALEVMLRLAGRLTVMARPLDTVARVGEARYGVLIEGPVPPDRAAPLASKFLARLILPFAGLPRGLTVRAKVAVALVPSQAASMEEALAVLDVLLLGAHPQESKSIFTVEPVSELSLPA